jgi:hypothetical protein
MPRSGGTEKYVTQISFVGRSSGLVKNLTGFRKQHHTVPDAVNAATSGFLAKIATDELGTEAEDLFQRTKSALGYKRADLSLDVTPPTAALTARDFTLELEYRLNDADPASFTVTRTLHSIRNKALLETAGFDALFAGKFSSLVFALAKGVKVEAVVDAIESADGSKLSVNYPSDCRYCVIQVDHVAAELTCDGATLELRFPKASSPNELVSAFGEVRDAFALSKNRTLGGLL